MKKNNLPRQLGAIKRIKKQRLWLFLGQSKVKLRLSHLRQRPSHEIQLLCDVWLWKREDEVQF
jgi:hypothetical protein